MTLEDFFTLTEMNNGLIAPARVKELVAIIRRENDCVIKNISDVTRQWSAVASAIAATDNQDCLHLFIQLDGLRYLNRWLKAAGNVRNNTSDNFVEDTITDILQALERLQVDKDKLIASGILMTVKDLLDHSSSKVQGRAKSLFKKWNKEKENDADQMGVEKNGALDDEGTGVTAEHAGSSSPKSSNEDINASKGSVTVEKREEASKDDEPTIVSETLNTEEMSNRISDDASMEKEISHSTDPFSLSKAVNENPHNNRCCSESAALTESCSSAGLKQGEPEGELHTTELDFNDNVKPLPKIESSPKKVDKVEVPKSSVSTDDTDAPESVKEHGIKKNSNAIEKDCSSKTSCSAGLRTAESVAKSRTDDDTSPSYCRSNMVLSRKEDGDCNSDVLRDTNTREHKLETFKDSGTLFRRMEYGVDKENSDRNEGGFPKDYDFPKPRMVRKDYAVDKKSDLDLDYGIVDALELARQVAIEVEREVEDCREQSCSSSEKELSSKVRQPESPHSVSGKQFQTDQSSPVKVPTRSDLSLSSPVRDVPATSAGNPEVEQINGAPDGESSHVTEAAEEVEASSGKGISQFDLNEEFCSNDTEHQGDIMSPPVSVVSASRAAAAPGMPVAPLQFEGTLGWKGSATTSAFRPASPRRVPENESGLSANGSNSSSKQNRGFLDFDLNVAEIGEDRITDLQSRKEIPLSSRLASGESSVEASSRRLERIGLDLNQIGDDGGAPPDWRAEVELFHRRNDHHSQSPSCSSSSKQPSLRNIDLNDQPIFANGSSNNHYYSKSSQNLSSLGGIRSDDSVVSIMGVKVEVNRGNSASRTIPLPDGRTPEPTTNFDFLRSGGNFGIRSQAPYSHPPVYGYNGLAAGPAMPFTSPMYGPGGPIPYMVDSRGAPVVPQFMGSSSSLPPGFSQPPYVFSMTGTPSSNSVGPMRNSFDLNSGLILEGGNRDIGGFRQFLNPAQTLSIDDQFKSNSQPSTSSGIGGGKRKEPDGGWELFPFKPHSQPWR